MRNVRSVCDNPKCAVAKRQQDRERENRERYEAAQVELSRWVPQVLRKATPADLVPELCGWQPHQSVFLHGPVGTGKSHQVAALMHTIAGQVPFEWHRTRKLIGDAQAAMNRGRDKQTVRPFILDYPCIPRVLVLDDLGVERPTDYAIDQIGEVIMARYDKQLPVIVTSNLSLGELASDSLSLDRISSRLVEMCMGDRGFIVNLKGQDRRVAT
jgi:DNA replication protein DnaC